MSDTTDIKHPTTLTFGTLADFTEAGEPFALFGAWFAEACKAEPNDPNAMALATVDADGLPDVRMVLMKGYDADGFVFYSHIASPKGRELATNPKAALLFHWKSLRRQVRIRGNVSPVSEAEADAYFATRPKQAQIGAWASKQSQPLESRFAFEQAIAKVAAFASRFARSFTVSADADASTKMYRFRLSNHAHLNWYVWMPSTAVAGRAIAVTLPNPSALDASPPASKLPRRTPLATILVIG